MKLCLCVHPSTRVMLEQLAADQRRPMSEVVEGLIRQVDTGLDDYFRRQSAFHGFMAAALLAAVAAKVLGPDATRQLQDRVAPTARRLYGRSPQRNFDVEQGLASEEDDPRVRAIFGAYGAV